MIDRKPAGEWNKFFKKPADSAGDFEDSIGISNKAKVYMVIILLIIILCIVYVMQLRSARNRGNTPAAENAATYRTAEMVDIEEPMEEDASQNYTIQNPAQ